MLPRTLHHNRNQHFLPAAQSIRHFSNDGGKGNGDFDNDTGYVSDEDGKEHESDRRFSNFILFAGCLGLGGILMASNVMQLKR